jgi:hypothetical protein
MLWIDRKADTDGQAIASASKTSVASSRTAPCRPTFGHVEARQSPARHGARGRPQRSFGIVPAASHRTGHGARCRRDGSALAKGVGHVENGGHGSRQDSPVLRSGRNPFHLEDDWLAHADIGEGDVLPYFNGPVRQVSILTVEKNWKSRYPFHCAWERRRFLGVEFGRRLYPDRPLFTTSPSFVEREFARTCSRLMDPSLDPEKQLYDNRNVALSSYTSSFQNRIIGGRNPYWIEDIGRADRDRRGTRKVIAGGQSHWIGNEAADRTEQ